MAVLQTEGSLARKSSDTRVITIAPSERHQWAKLRVAAYARVSSSSEDQLQSFAAQNNYYTALIAGKDNWEQVDIYADEGITGTSAEKRPEFQRMLQDCRRGRIDRILVKSISRFARNTKECLETIRELKGIGVSVSFEKEGIDTGNMSGEMLTTLFATFAQAESESISGNMRWSIKKRMENGTFLPSSMAYGYRIENHQIVIDPDEAEIVREIFRSYLAGMGKAQIARMLNRMEIPTGQGHQWSYHSIHYVLGNERYIGDSLWQKTYATDAFPHQKVKNHGEKEKYYAEGTHPAIITKEEFQAVQALAEQRQRKFGRAGNQEHPLSKKLFCSDCGGVFRRKVIRGKTYWSCLKRERGGSCQTKPIPEREVYRAFQRLYWKLRNHMELLEGMMTKLQSVRNRRMLWSEDVMELNSQISDLSSQNQMLTQLKKQGLIAPDIFYSQSNELLSQIREAKFKKERLLAGAEDRMLHKTQEMQEVLEAGPEYMEQFDAEIFAELVERVLVTERGTICFQMINGLLLSETIERGGM